MVNPETVSSLLNNLENFQGKLVILSRFSRDDFLRDFTKVESAKHLLQVSVQCCLDLAHHIIADEGFRAPQDSYDAFVVLNEHNIIPDDFLPTLRTMVSFRNRTVHLYWHVDDSLIFDILQSNLDDFSTFTRYILDYLNPTNTQ
ncbi:MAG: DUF86 domain-containing protein [Chloroflexi bacterium]|nr:MAG: DUF86 domain-containing protein [Chloroflexota bacterium]